MECKMTKPIDIRASMCDHNGCLSAPAVFALFMDLASEHGSAIQLGMHELSAKGLFWLTVKTRIRFHRAPSMLDTVTADTWPEKPGRIRCNRYYVLRDGDEVLAEGKTEWAIIDMASGKLQKLSEVYPGDLNHLPDVVCPGAYARIPENFSDCPEIGTYTVRSTDIDLGQHMNNSAYVRVMFGAFSCAQTDAMHLQEAEVSFRSPCFEGDTLSIRTRPADNGMDVGMVRADGTTAIAARLTFGEAR